MKASAVVLGTWGMGGWMWGGCDDSLAERTILTALDAGINIIDTAPIYGFGRSEETVGRALQSRQRDQVIIASKCGLYWNYFPLPADHGEWHCYSNDQGLTETLEKYVNENSTVLDIGCGSGILSIACLLLGAKSAFGVDIDSLAVKTAMANARENGFGEEKFKVVQGNLSDKVKGKYNIIVANIVADIIMEFNRDVGRFLEDNGVYITGGIIDSREDEVLASFSENGFKVIERFEEKGWLVFVLKK